VGAPTGPQRAGVGGQFSPISVPDIGSNRLAFLSSCHLVVGIANGTCTQAPKARLRPTPSIACYLRFSAGVSPPSLASFWAKRNTPLPPFGIRGLSVSRLDRLVGVGWTGVLEVQRPCGARTESSRLGAGGNFTPYTRYCMYIHTYIHTYILTPGSVGAGDSGGLVCWSPVLGCWSLLSSGSSLSFVLHNLSVHPRDEKRPSGIYLPTPRYRPPRIGSRRGREDCSLHQLSRVQGKREADKRCRTTYLHRPVHSTNTLSSLTGCIAGCIAGCPGRTRLIIYYSRRPTPLQRKPSLLRSASELLPHQTIRPIEAMAVLVSPLS
jgi:hypothetical protein